MYFETVLTERNGEYLYTFPYLVEADTIEEALEKANKFASEWYEGEDSEYIESDNCWYFNGGEVAVSLSQPVKTTLKKYFEYIKDKYLIE
jgi:hypothetical protein